MHEHRDQNDDLDGKTVARPIRHAPAQVEALFIGNAKAGGRYNSSGTDLGSSGRFGTLASDVDLMS